MSIVVEERKHQQQMPLFELEKFCVSQIHSIKLKKEAVKQAKEQLDRLLDQNQDYRITANKLTDWNKAKKELVEELKESDEAVAAAFDELAEAREDLKDTKALLSANLIEYEKHSGKETIKVDEVDTKIKKVLSV